ncbi:MAG TPA: TonB-dependent receptor [Myxococcales bacterium]|nr:TonB-dependent receptor [Myxococcales bacterium]
MRRSGIWSLFAALSLSGAAAAQEERSRAEVVSPDLGERRGTASPLPRTDAIPLGAILEIPREQIDASAAASIGDFLQQLPQQSGALNNKVNSGGDGQTQMNLRNIGSRRTLVLVDGKRIVNGGVGAGTAVDLNTIPTASVERVEILLDGGSTLYGSDAIGGVVNIITRKRMDGVRVNGYSGVSEHGDAATWDVNLLGGTFGDRGSLLFGAGYFDQQPLIATGRDWSATTRSYDFANRQEGSFSSGIVANTRVNALDPGACPTKLCQDLAAQFGAGTRLNFVYDPARSKPGATYVDGWRLRDPAFDVYNTQAFNDLVTPSHRISLFGNGEYRLADFARPYFQASYVERESRSQFSPDPLSSLGLSASNPYNPFAVNIPSLQRRLAEVGPRGSAFDVSTSRIVAGVDGKLGAGPLRGWSWDAWVDYGRSAGTSTSAGTLDTRKLGPAIGPGFTDANGAHCGTPAAPIENCTPVDLFVAPSALDATRAAQLGAYTGINQGTTQLFLVGATLGGGLFRIAADRPVDLTIGLEHRNEFGTFINEPIVAAGLDSDNFPPGPADVRGGFYANEAYAELRVPVVSHAPFLESLELQLAARVSSYSTFGFDWTYAVAARWRPTRDVTLRGSYSTALRAPRVSELFLGQKDSVFESSNDPCANTHGDPALARRCSSAPGDAGGPAVPNNGITLAMINSVVGGNPLLQPEKANIATVGVVIEPQAVRGLSMSAGFYTVSIEGLIATYGTQFILNKCYGAAGVSQDTSFCRSVSRDPGTHAVSQVVDVNANVSAVLTQGIDVAAGYALPTGAGRFTFRFDGTYLLTYDSTDAAGFVIHGAGNYDGQGSVTPSGSTNFNPRVKFNAGVTYDLARFSAGIVGRFIGPLTECSPFGGIIAGANTGPGFCYLQARPDGSSPVGPGNQPYPEHRVSAQLTLDLLAAYRFTSPAGATTVALGVRNVLDQVPPRLYDSFLTYADPSYDFIGRFVYGRVEHKF